MVRIRVFSDLSIKQDGVIEGRGRILVASKALNGISSATVISKKESKIEVTFSTEILAGR